MTVTIDGATLTIEDVARVARRDAQGRFAPAALAQEARARIAATRAYIDATWMHDDAPLMYAFNTGVGLFKDQRVRIADMVAYQQKTIFAHATGVGEPFAEDVTRATMLLRANAFASNYSGPRVEVVERLLAFLAAGLHPVIPQKGSVGASGDLAPLAHMTGALCGFAEAEIVHNGKRMPARVAIAEAGLEPDFPLFAKDASAFINGSTVSLALAALATHDARRILKTADVALALTLEAMRGELAAFDARVHRARPHPGQARTARNVLRLTAGSRRCSEEARHIVFPDENRDPAKPPPPRVQDVYSLRCGPQVHGPVADALGYIEGVVGTEINSATDNPLIFDDGAGGYVSISGGHFHGQYIAQAMDLLGIAIADLGSISERRLARLIDPTMSYGLPRNLLAGKRGLNTGFATVQCSMSALVMENRTLATPGSVDSIPGKSNAEDHVSNSTWCARKACTIVENVEQIVATEILMAAQALSLVGPLAKDHPLGRGTAAVLEAVRAVIPPALDGDRWYATEMGQILELARSGAILSAAESVIGALE
ncbi:aromatic amino acid ammonia-lyase [Chelatococcus sp. SYSU_G07232]|uniref:Aromatic amino acid ammonia-lyase n=1 Tax=Chelatococcus albus TaxID=3047466 RepID=A0ABT7AM63_9HYPH|nr:aromatic amino acid ammonia-lyase [Chelatococcus sp. SYSU_G07232]MDJ1160165.1 aromatic amino acid ammonia-lyase [Chelatococcus sp. SYSU_G07232]